MKRSKSRKNKKPSKKLDLVRPYHFLVLEGLILILAILLQMSGIPHKSTVSGVQVIKPAIATSSATQASASTTPKPAQNQIPVSYGKQIRVPILTYHYIGKNPNPADKLRDNLSVDPDLFDAQMGYLAKSGYNPITLDTMLAGLRGTTSLPPKPIIITFDDGYVDLYLNAYPILRKYGFHGVAFIPTGLIGTKYYASWAQIREMSASGLIEMEAHSVHHTSLISVSLPQVDQEIIESKKTLEANTGIPANFMAYPYGTSNQLVWDEVKKTGYLGALGTWSGDIISEGNIYDMPRIKIPGGMSVAAFAARI